MYGEGEGGVGNVGVVEEGVEGGRDEEEDEAGEEEEEGC